jgi:hypothetical protein
MSGDAVPGPVPTEANREAVMAKKVLKKIDRVIIPLLFITYIFNFADKVILSSAAVFGLREDNVSICEPWWIMNIQDGLLN